MDLIAAVATDASGPLPTMLPKSPSRASLASSAEAGDDASASLTLCETASGVDVPHAKSAPAASAHSREIRLLDLSPEDLDVAQALGDRNPAAIECLRINRCRMTGEGFSSLVDVLCTYDLPHLRTIDISQNRVGGAQAGAALAKLLAHAGTVRFLSLGWNQLVLADLKAMAAPETSAYAIQTLDLRANPLGGPSSVRKQRKRAGKGDAKDGSDEAWIGALAASLPCLTHLQLAQATVDDGSLVTLLHALTGQHSRIEYIGLEWLGLGARLATVRSIMSGLVPADFASAPCMLHLNLAANNLGDAGIKIIAESGARLSSLTLACNFITERGAGMIAKWLPSSGLTALELCDNYFGDQGIASLLTTDGRRLSSDSPYCQLMSLGLNSCCLTDTSLRAIADALTYNWAPLQSLHILRNNRVSPGARVAL
ncbi:NACHT, LRR and PYD domains-containing protein 14 [Coemansia sp. RSA 552]|nr:NACHT, LRR and PYD domains-containing protein 14 [Coemansia sp. RSA 552]